MKTTELTGAALDWAVAKSEGFELNPTLCRDQVPAQADEEGHAREEELKHGQVNKPQTEIKQELNTKHNPPVLLVGPSCAKRVGWW